MNRCSLNCTPAGFLAVIPCERGSVQPDSMLVSEWYRVFGVVYVKVNHVLHSCVLVHDS